MFAYPKMVAAIALISLVLLVFSACTLTRAGYPSAGYAVRALQGRVEIREYPELMLAQTAAASESQGKDGSFRRLFRFIAKGNADAQAIPMTTPVLYRKVEAGERMAFVLPLGMTSQTAPNPVDPSVELAARVAGTFASVRMRGGRTAAARAAAVGEIRAALDGSEWQLEGEPEFAYYDPPWIPAMFGKNEVIWRVIGKKATR